MPVMDIRIARPMLGDEEKRAVMAVLDSGHLAQGPVVEEFERAFADCCGVRHAVAVSSGTAALHALFLAYGFGAGDEVITSPFTFVASANAALFAGARPVFVDVEPDTFCLDPNLVEAAITPRTKALLPVHLYGHPAAMLELQDIADRHGLILIEDACQAIGAEMGGRRAGNLAHSAVFSLYATKNITSGEGGFVTTNDDQLAQRVRLLRNHGSTGVYQHEIVGFNFRLSDLHAAVGLAQLQKLECFNLHRRRNAGVLTRGLAGVDRLLTPIQRSGYVHVYHQYTVRVRGGRADLPTQLAGRGIATAVHYPVPVHLQPLYQQLGFTDVHLPVAEQLAHEVLSLPVHPGVSSGELDYIVESLCQLV
jgi:perosamine synthetase